MAGFETTSGTIHVILHDLAQHPHVQTRLREELLAADSAEVETIEALPYLDAVTREG
jgi:cytochrome P450